MSDYYFEVNRQYCEEFNFDRRIFHTCRFHQLMVESNRIWKETEEGDVLWLKNTFKKNDKPIPLDSDELKEFFWIKLSAINV